MKDYQLIDKELIKERSLKYGNNFPMIAELWNNYFKTILGVDVDVSQRDVAMLMGLMKISRLNNSPNDEDTLNDLFNYMWIGENYNEYLDMIQCEDDWGDQSYNNYEEEYCDECDEDEQFIDLDSEEDGLNYIIDIKGLMEELNKILDEK